MFGWETNIKLGRTPDFSTVFVLLFHIPSLIMVARCIGLSTLFWIPDEFIHE